MSTKTIPEQHCPGKGQAEQATRESRAKRRKRIATGVALLLLGLAALPMGATLIGRRSIPVLEGSQQVTGLAQQLEIIRDGWAIPHVYARSVEDAYFGLGYAHAQDRLWQLELNRRFASGTLAEVLGERALDSDKFQRTLGLRRAARETWSHLDEPTRAALEAYSRGVNAWLAEKRPLPPEFVLCRFEPEPWEPLDSLAFLKLMAWNLSGNWGEEMWRVRLRSALSPERVAALDPIGQGPRPVDAGAMWRVYDQNALTLNAGAGRSHAARAADPSIAVAAVSTGQSWLAQFAESLRRLQPLAPARLGGAIGSNNWVIAGSRTESGRPLVANDPHLGLNAPSQWYLAHLEAPGLSVIGSTLPALPGVILGQNERVAWAFTNMAPDTEDLYIEKLAAEGDERYLTPGGVASFERVREIIHVRGQEDVTLDVRSTRHGPVISDVSDDARALLPPGYVLALAWVGFAGDDRTMSFPIHAALARDADEFREAARRFESPAQNIVYADATNAIGYVGAGRVPLRRAGNALHGLIPAPGWLAEYDWNGFIPFEELPQSRSPEAGRLVTANQDVTPAGYAYLLGKDFGRPYRAERITALLDARNKHSVESLEAIQQDVHSRIADELLPVLLGMLPQPESPAARRAVIQLRAWNRDMSVSGAEPLIFAAWLRELQRRVYADELGELFEEARDHIRTELLRDALTEANGSERWCDDVHTPAVEGCAELVAASLDGALGYLQARFGDESRWSWGKAHPSRSEHLLFGGLPLIGSRFDIFSERGGDGSTVNVATYATDDDETAFSTSWGPGFRAVYDLANRDRSVAILNSGESGHFLSAHYRDMNPLWARGQYVPLVTQRRDVERGALGKITLLPRALSVEASSR